MFLFRRQVSRTFTLKSLLVSVSCQTKSISRPKSVLSFSSVFSYDQFVDVPLTIAPLRYAPRSPLALPHSRFSQYLVAVSVGRSSSCRNCLTRSSCEFYQKRYHNTCANSKKDKMCDKKTFQRLPKTVRPTHYDLSLVPDLKKLIFQGDVGIEIEVGQSNICRLCLC